MGDNERMKAMLGILGNLAMLILLAVLIVGWSEMR
jgi:hypothetical protein